MTSVFRQSSSAAGLCQRQCTYKLNQVRHVAFTKPTTSSKADAPEAKGLSEGGDIQSEMREILDWFGTVWTATPPLSNAPKHVQQRYRRALRFYKSEEIRRVKAAEVRKEQWKQRQLSAILALPPRLRLTALCDVDDRWVEHQLPELIETIPEYDSDNYRTWPVYRKTLFEYNWRPGTEIPMQRVAKKSFDKDEVIERQLDDSDLNFKLDGTKIYTTETDMKDWIAESDLNKMFDKKKYFANDPKKGKQVVSKKKAAAQTTVKKVVSKKKAAAQTT